MFIELINPETRLCSIHGTALRSSKYDSEVKSNNGTHIDYYKYYNLHCIATVTDSIIPLLFDLQQLTFMIIKFKVYYMNLKFIIHF
ncbi:MULTISPECIES: hypothetical protein [unclassified Clostridium]|uniref:hypothetical protein n=1 Tax=unclassified Clostridium TaxID=2614128 RepID=UPI00207A1B0C|nr:MULTISPECIES: hypothetical protein [unclassified Clostridium]